MPLSHLDCIATAVDDLAPLAGKPLLSLKFAKTKVTNLEPLRGMKLLQLAGDFDRQRDGPILKTIGTLSDINGRPAAEFWN
jgi:hypothetical protein